VGRAGAAVGSLEPQADSKTTALQKSIAMNARSIFA
jgi:hypothetical protein